MKRITTILILAAMFAAMGAQAQSKKFTFTENFNPSRGFAYKGTITVSFHRREAATNYTYVYVSADITRDNISYIYNGKTYTSADVSSIASNNGFIKDWSCEIGVQYRNNPIVWVKYVSRALLPGQVSLAELKVVLPKVEITDMKSREEFSAAYQTMLSELRAVGIRNCGSSICKPVEDAINRKLDNSGNSSGSSSSSSGSSSSSSGSSSSSSNRSGSSTASSGYSSGSSGNSYGSSSSGGSNASNTETAAARQARLQAEQRERERQQKAEADRRAAEQKAAAIAAQNRRVAESQRNLEKATNDFVGALASIANDKAAAAERREERARIERETAAEYERIEREAAAERKRIEREAAAERARIEREHAAYVSGKRDDLRSNFKDGKIPLSADNVTAAELWYFAWQNNGTQVYVSEVFPIARYSDGAYPFKNTVTGEISKAGGVGAVTLVGWFYNREDAEQAHDRFVQTAHEGEMTIKNINYKGKPKTAGNTQQDGDFWGTSPAKTNAPATTNTPTQKSGTKKKDDFWD